MSRSSPLGASTSESLLAPETPYRGLTPYSEQDAPLFFGREDECDIVTDNLMASRLTLLYGASGVGKTSLLRAGVTHELLASSRRNIVNYGSPEFVVVYFNRWSDDPVAALTRCIQESVATAMGGQAEELAITSAQLAETLHGWTTRLGSDLLIILDQFEEYFLYHPDDGGDGSFAVEFPQAVDRADLRVSFLVSIREDALARLDRFKGRIPNLFDNYLRTRHLDLAAARAAIEKPLEAYNRLVSADEPFTAEPELVQMVLDQVQIGKVTLGTTGRGMIEPGADQAVGDRRIETPYLQLVLTRLWREEVAAGSRTLRAETLRRLGGAQQIVRTHLDEALRALPAGQQDVAAGIFHHLVTPSGSKIAHTAPDLADYAQLSEAEVVSVLEQLSGGDARILRPVPPPSGQPEDTPAYEIFHDVLAPAILDWWTRHTESRAAEARLGARLEQSAEQTQAAERRARQYRRWLTRVSVVAMALLLALVSVVAVLAIRGRKAADRRAALALELQHYAHSGELAATALAQLPSDPGSSVSRALDALAEDDTPQAETALRRALSASRLRVTFQGHQDQVTSASFSPDDRHVLTAGNDNTVRVWTADTGRQVAVLKTAAPPYHIAGRPRFGPGGDLVLVTTRDGKVEAWAWQTNDPPVPISRGQDADRAVFSPDGSHVATGHLDGTTRVWTMPPSRPPAVLPPSGQDSFVTSLAFSPDGGQVATADNSGMVRLWDWREPGPPTLLDGHEGYVSTVVFSPDGRLLLSSGDDQTARLWKVPSGTPAPVLRGHTGPVLGAAFSLDGKLVVTASNDKTARVFDTGTGRLLSVLSGHTDEVLEATFDHSGRIVATAGADGTARLWYADSGGMLAELRGHGGAVFTAAFSLNSRSLVTASADETARSWDVGVGQVFWGHEGAVVGAVYSRDGARVVTADAAGAARVFDAATGRRLALLREPGGTVNNAVFNRDRRLVLTAGTNAAGEGVARLWTLATPKRTGRVVAKDALSIDTAELSPDERSVMTTTTEAVTIRDLRSGKPTVTIERSPNQPFNTIAMATFSPDGRLVLTAHFDKTARLWEAGTGKPVRTLRGHRGIVYSAAFTPDGKQLVTAGGDGTARVWETASGHLLHTLPAPSGQLRSAAFSADGKWVAVAGAEGTVTVFDVASERVLAVRRQHSDLISTVAFNPVDKRILTAGDDTTAKAFHCESCGPMQQLLPLARQRARLAGGTP